MTRAKRSSKPARPLLLRRDPALAAEFAGLRYVNPDERGYTRRRCGRGFAYFSQGGQLISNPRIKARIAKLAIPPAWTKVWICASARGHVQATGYDDRGRKQYIYHSQWVAVRDRAKFSALPAFGRALPNIRRRVLEDIAREEFGFEKAVATVIRFMDDTLIRVGNQRYTRANATFGLTTLRKRHVEIEQHEVCLQFIGKGGKRIHLCVEDPELAALACECVEIPGYHLFKFFDEQGRRRRVESHHVNAYLQDAAGAAAKYPHRVSGIVHSPADHRELPGRQLHPPLPALARAGDRQAHRAARHGRDRAGRSAPCHRSRRREGGLNTSSPTTIAARSDIKLCAGTPATRATTSSIAAARGTAAAAC